MKKISRFLVMILLMGLLTGCTRSELEREEGSYHVYYINQRQTGLVKESYMAKAVEVNELIAELLEVMKTPEDQKNHYTLLSEDVEIGDFRYDAGNVSLYMGASYGALPNTREVLIRAGLVRTLVQIDGVETVSFYVGGVPLCDSKGEPVGRLNAEAFIENSGKEINSYKNVTIVLYFTNEDGTQLVAETRKLYYSSNISLEQVIVEQLLAGPKAEEHYPVLPSDAKAMSVTVVDKICYVNFDKTFLESALNVQEQIPIYSIVNSLVENCSLNKVQISIDGESDLIFRESMNLGELYTINRDLIQMSIQ